MDILAYQYDIVCNGIELSSDAIRNHKPDLMYKLFSIAGYDKKQVDEKYDAAKNAAYENFVPENIKEMIEHPLVPGTAVGPIDHRAFKEKKDVV